MTATFFLFFNFPNDMPVCRYAVMARRGEGLEALVHLFLIYHARFHAEGILASSQELARLVQLHHLHRGLHI